MEMNMEGSSLFEDGINKGEVYEESDNVSVDISCFNVSINQIVFV